MSNKDHARKTVYRRDNEDQRGQGVFSFAPGAAISTFQAAEIIGCCDDTIREMCESGELKAYRLRPDKPNSPWRVIKDSVYRHLAKVSDTFALDEPGLPTTRITPSTPAKR